MRPGHARLHGGIRSGGIPSPEPGDTPPPGSVSPSGLPRVIEGLDDEGESVSWGRILELWQLVEADMHEHYGIDLAEPGLLERRSGRWLKTRLNGLLSTDSRLHRVLYPPKERA